jgi:hypothetical protein
MMITCTHTCGYACMYVTNSKMKTRETGLMMIRCMYVCIHVGMYACMHVYVCMYAYMWECMHACVCMYVQRKDKGDWSDDD